MGTAFKTLRELGIGPTSAIDKEATNPQTLDYKIQEKDSKNVVVGPQSGLQHHQ
jgi:hypothetical protein